MNLDRPAKLLREAVIRDGHRCSICGRPCGEAEARRHSEAGAFGDSSLNFAAMCHACQTWLAHEGVRPAQYVTHLYDASLTRRRLRWLADKAALALFLSVYLAYAGLAATVIYWTPHNVFTVLGSALLIFYLLHLGTSFLAGFREARSGSSSVRQLDHRFDEPVIRTDNQL